MKSSLTADRIGLASFSISLRMSRGSLDSGAIEILQAAIQLQLGLDAGRVPVGVWDSIGLVSGPIAGDVVARADRSQ